MRTPTRTRLFAAAAFAATAAAVAVAPLPAAASPGDQSVVTGCNPSAWQTPVSGTGKGKIRNCAITWSRNVADGDYWQVVDFELYDAVDGDGHCAQASTTGSSTVFSSCSGSWERKTRSLSGQRSSITVTLTYSGAGSVAHTVTAPSGY
ncbi:hypothetical protein Lfu02_05950 [Longispora fulva]|uniref:Secreted protein n=1 Tax=Longispora fulva TaxID=619741 RepID=A0A8J7KNS6_9ACTN|nr:hypothetical protein [Longispora fulva]MBG6135537.1 hypothetical protein [Longispora fulva]GIG56223.1 hypothetical protein Lfu02_05950 [Longispora fulva]